jgi:hypothetical protein
LVDDDRLGLAFDNFPGNPAAESVDGALEGADTGVVTEGAGNEGPDRLIDPELTLIQTGIFESFGHEKSLGDGNLLGITIAWHLDKLKSVKDGGRDIGGVVGGGHEEDLG